MVIERKRDGALRQYKGELSKIVYRAGHNTTKTKRVVVQLCVVYVRFNRDLPLDNSYVRFIVIDDIVPVSPSSYSYSFILFIKSQ